MSSAHTIEHKHKNARELRGILPCPSQVSAQKKSWPTSILFYNFYKKILNFLFFVLFYCSQGMSYVKRNAAAASGFAGGFLIGLTL